MTPSRRASSDDRLLGSLETEIAGEQFYDAEIALGDEVHLEREPENSHDPNAIRVGRRRGARPGRGVTDIDD